jgi:hypothetical protein
MYRQPLKNVQQPQVMGPLPCYCGPLWNIWILDVTLALHVKACWLRWISCKQTITYVKDEEGNITLGCLVDISWEMCSNAY